MSRTLRVSFYASLAIFAIRLGLLSDDPNYQPPALTLKEFTWWAAAWVFMTQYAMAAAKSAIEEKILGLTSWAITCGTLIALAVPFQMDGIIKVVFLTLLCALLFFPISNVTTWRPWGHSKG